MPYLYRLIDEDRNLMGRKYDIIKGAEFADLEEVRGAIREDKNSVNTQDPDTGLTAMHITAADGNISVFNELMKQDHLDLSITDYWDRTAIDLANEAGHFHLAQRLMERAFPQFFSDDGDPYPEYPEGVTPL